MKCLNLAANRLVSNVRTGSAQIASPWCHNLDKSRSYLFELPQGALLLVLLDRVADFVGRDLELLARATRNLAHKVEVASGLTRIVADVQRNVMPDGYNLITVSANSDTVGRVKLGVWVRWAHGKKRRQQ